MMDNRRPDLNSWAQQHGRNELTLVIQARLVTMLTAYLNTRYACRHGYELLFYKLVETGCMHPLWGTRHPSYCKLAAIGEALAAGYRWVVYLDSDAFVRSAETLPALLHRYGASSGVDTDMGGGDVFFGWDHPFTLGPNMGFIALRNSASSREMVRVWWNSFAGSFSTLHPFEQHTLQWNVMHLSRFRERVQTLSVRTMDDSYPDAVVHLDHNAGTKTRIWVMVGAVAELLTSLELPHGRPLRKHLQLLRAQREGVSKKHRRPVIEDVVEAASRDLAFLESTKCLHRLVIPFNATDSALTHLWHRYDGAHRAFGIGVVKQGFRGNATYSKSTATTTSISSGALSQRGVVTEPSGLLAGTPLRLVNCSESALHAPWQSWQLAIEQLVAKGQAACTGLCIAHRFSLLVAPTLCLSLGVTRTPRNPYQTLAQLESCEAVAATPAALRARLHFSAKAGTIKTTHRVSDFRKGLPEHKLTCGFWPACAGTRLLLPKPCWARLQTNVTACGVQEETVANFLERDRRKGTQVVDPSRGFVVGASGPTPASILNTSGRDRLCLTAWRGHVGLKNPEGTAAVFLRCPQGAGRKWRDRSLFEWRTEPAASARGSTLRVESTSGMAVRLKPRGAPHLCLAAPPLPM